MDRSARQVALSVAAIPDTTSHAAAASMVPGTQVLFLPGQVDPLDVHTK